MLAPPAPSSRQYLMMTPTLLDHLISHAAQNTPAAMALSDGKGELTYAALDEAVSLCANGLLNLGLQRGERVAVYLDKRFETVIACFGAARAGCVFVPVNPLLKSAQVEHILRDCNVRILITSSERYALLQSILGECPDLQHVVTVNAAASTLAWADLLAAPAAAAHAVAENDITAIFYTSGSTGKPKGVVLSHRNLLLGAISVASYLHNNADDILLAALPLSFDAGFSQLTTAFYSGAKVVLLNYLLPQDVLKALARERITGLTAVPPLYMQLTQLTWPVGLDEHLRYFANTGGRMPLATLNKLRANLPRSQPFLMYGLTEAFRSTYLPPEQAEQRPDSIGKAIPNTEILVLRPDGSLCDADEPGELVHRGPLVSLGYWNDAATTAERFKPLPKHIAAEEVAVYSGDTVRRDKEGFLYFIGRDDEMIKTSGYRVSPTEIEEAVFASGLVAECCAFGVEDAKLGQSISLIAVPTPHQSVDAAALLAYCRNVLPAFMLPATIHIQATPLPRNANGKLDRKLLSTQPVTTS
ncbi:MAG TPA: acyl-CoA ligase (AMP-forming), exosortase A system-associated [Rhodocyclaceae bacterium]|nr:acyl-CoA ligase (AMP-forming), exosortase A system-associated [Rhodocyclaceae bacterium]